MAVGSKIAGHWPQTAGGCLIQVQNNVKLAGRNWDWLLKAGGCLIEVAARAGLTVYDTFSDTYITRHFIQRISCI